MADRSDKASKAKKFNQLLSWFSDHEVWFDKDKLDIRIVRDMSGYELGVFARKPLHRGDTVCRIARSAILSARSCGIANLLEDEMVMPVEEEDEEESDSDGSEVGEKPDCIGITDRVALTLGVMFEMSRGEQSPWHGYLQSLPESEPLPIFWSDAQLEWLRGTCAGASALEDREGIERDYTTQVAPFVEKYRSILVSDDYIRDKFMRVSSVVASRAFYVDEYHGEAMVPLADIFNHKTCGEHVHLESDPEVCLACGAAFGCEHTIDVEDPPFTSTVLVSSEVDPMPTLTAAVPDTGMGPSVALNANRDATICDDDEEGYEDEEDEDEDEEMEDVLEINVVREERPGKEVFNTYGERGNGHLLSHYGFAEELNPSDLVIIPRELVFAVCARVLSSAEKVQERMEFFEANYAVFNTEDEDEGSGSDSDDGAANGYAGSDGDVMRMPDNFDIAFGGMTDLTMVALLAVIRTRDELFNTWQQSPEQLAEGALGIRDTVTEVAAFLCDTPDLRLHKPITKKRPGPMTVQICRLVREIARERLDAFQPSTSIPQDIHRKDRLLAAQDRNSYYALLCRISEKRILMACIERCERAISQAPARRLPHGRPPPGRRGRR